MLNTKFTDIILIVKGKNHIFEIKYFNPPIVDLFKEKNTKVIINTELIIIIGINNFIHRGIKITGTYLNTDQDKFIPPHTAKGNSINIPASINISLSDTNKKFSFLIGFTIKKKDSRKEYVNVKKVDSKITMK